MVSIIELWKYKNFIVFKVKEKKGKGGGGGALSSLEETSLQDVDFKRFCKCNVSRLKSFYCSLRIAACWAMIVLKSYNRKEKRKGKACKAFKYPGRD
jgi:hypothetical protein